MIEDKAVLNAYWLYKDNLIDSKTFYETIEKIKQSMTTQTHTAFSPQEITPGQKNYISRLKMEGKIPQSQTLEISKQEAQILIHNALNQPNKTECVTDNTPNEQAQTGSAKTPEELKELYEGGVDY